MMVISRPTRSSIRSESALMFFDPSASIAYAARAAPDDSCQAFTICSRYSSQISTTSTAMRYQR